MATSILYRIIGGGYSARLTCFEVTKQVVQATGANI